MYAFLYVADKSRRLVIVGNPDPKAKTPGVATLLDGDPSNNFLRRARAFNPEGVLNGARAALLSWEHLLTCCATVGSLSWT